MSLLPYDPGVLPTKPAPTVNEIITLEVLGLPPKKTIPKSIRNRTHRQHSSFLALRQAATVAMAGRAWVFDAVALDLTLYAPTGVDRWALLEFQGGIMDTLGGSSGQTFTFLPIVYEDDAQVCDLTQRWTHSETTRYVLIIKFIGGHKTDHSISI
jgi:hypothetical protein